MSNLNANCKKGTGGHVTIDGELIIGDHTIPKDNPIPVIVCEPVTVIVDGEVTVAPNGDWAALLEAALTAALEGFDFPTIDVNVTGGDITITSPVQIDPDQWQALLDALTDLEVTIANTPIEITGTVTIDGTIDANIANLAELAAALDGLNVNATITNTDPIPTEISNWDDMPLGIEASLAPVGCTYDEDGNKTGSIFLCKIVDEETGVEAFAKKWTGVNSAAIVDYDPAVHGDESECAPEAAGIPQCVKWASNVIFVDNTGFGLNETFTISIENSDGTTATTTIPSAASWTANVDAITAALAALYPDAVVESRCNTPTGCGGLLPPPSDAQPPSTIIARYTSLVFCPTATKTPINITITESSNPQRIGRVLTLEAIQTPEKRGWICAECGEVPILYDSNWEPVPAADLPACWFECSETIPQPTAPTCNHTTVTGCDNGTEPPTDIIRIYTECDGVIMFADYIENADGGLDDYTLIGEFELKSGTVPTSDYEEIAEDCDCGGGAQDCTITQSQFDPDTGSAFDAFEFENTGTINAEVRFGGIAGTPFGYLGRWLTGTSQCDGDFLVAHLRYGNTEATAWHLFHKSQFSNITATTADYNRVAPDWGCSVDSVLSALTAQGFTAAEAQQLTTQFFVPTGAAPWDFGAYNTGFGGIIANQPVNGSFPAPNGMPFGQCYTITPIEDPSDAPTKLWKRVTLPCWDDVKCAILGMPTTLAQILAKLCNIDTTLSSVVTECPADGALAGADYSAAFCYINGRPAASSPWAWIDNTTTPPTTIASGSNLNEFTDAVEALGYTEWSFGERHYICPVPASFTEAGSHLFTADGDTASKPAATPLSETEGAPEKTQPESQSALAVKVLNAPKSITWTLQSGTICDTGDDRFGEPVCWVQGVDADGNIVFPNGAKCPTYSAGKYNSEAMLTGTCRQISLASAAAGLTAFSYRSQGAGTNQHRFLVDQEFLGANLANVINAQITAGTATICQVTLNGSVVFAFDPASTTVEFGTVGSGTDVQFLSTYDQRPDGCADEYDALWNAQIDETNSTAGYAFRCTTLTFVAAGDPIDADCTAPLDPQPTQVTKGGAGGGGGSSDCLTRSEILCDQTGDDEIFFQFLYDCNGAITGAVLAGTSTPYTPVDPEACFNRQVDREYVPRCLKLSDGTILNVDAEMRGGTFNHYIDPTTNAPLVLDGVEIEQSWAGHCEPKCTEICLTVGTGEFACNLNAYRWTVGHPPNLCVIGDTDASGCVVSGEVLEKCDCDNVDVIPKGKVLGQLPNNGGPIVQGDLGLQAGDTIDLTDANGNVTGQATVSGQTYDAATGQASVTLQSAQSMSGIKSIRKV